MCSQNCNQGWNCSCRQEPTPEFNPVALYIALTAVAVLTVVASVYLA